MCDGLSTSKHCVATVSTLSTDIIFLNVFLFLDGKSISWFLTKKGFNPSVEKHTSHPLNIFPLHFYLLQKQ